LDVMRLGSRAAIETKPDFNRWSTLSALELLPMLINDLEPAAFAIRPELEELQRTLEQRLGRPVRMSGSGSTLFTLYDSEDEAAVAAQRVVPRQNDCTIAAATTVAEIAPAYQDDLNAGAKLR
jgi:4-diphosphocytidyl-2-C-methyl-D-erythritol kinase